MTGARDAARVWSASCTVAMVTVVTRLAELTRVTVRTPALLHVHCQLALIRRAAVVPHGSCQRYIVDVAET